MDANDANDANYTCQPEESDPTFYTVEEVAALCRVTRQTVMNWIDEGSLKAKRFGAEHRRTIRIHKSEYDRLAGAK